MSTSLEIKKSKDKSFVYLYDVNYFKQDNGSYKRTRKLIKKLGVLEELEAQDPDAIEKLRIEYGVPSSKRVKLEDKDEIKAILSKRDIVRESDLSKDSFNQHCTLNYSLLALWSIWSKTLNLTNTLGVLQQRKHPNLQFSLNKALFYLSAIRLVSPNSILKEISSEASYVGNFLDGIELKDLYNSLDYINMHHDHIFKSIDRAVAEEIGRDYSLMFFDCTNAYFETDKDDSEWAEYRGNDIQNADGIAEGLDNEQVGLRYRGFSKEHRYDLPIVTIALIVDSNGIVVDFKIYPGNTSEFKTVKDGILSLKESFEINDFAFVADKGINSFNNICTLVDNGVGFAISNKVTSLKKDVKEEMLSFKSYQSFKSDADMTLEDKYAALQATNEMQIEADLSAQSMLCSYEHLIQKLKSFSSLTVDTKAIIELFEGHIKSVPKKACYKSIKIKKSGFIINAKGERISRTIDCNQLFTFNPVRFKRDLNVLLNQTINAIQAVENKSHIKADKKAWHALVLVSDDEDKDLKKEALYKASELNLDLIKSRLETLGLSSIIYKKASDNNELEPTQVLDIYSKLLKIEESFRIMKSQINLRPMFVRNENHIKGHINLCVIALIMMRILQIKMSKFNVHMSFNQIQELLSKALLDAYMTKDGDKGQFIFNNSEFILPTITNVNQYPSKAEAINAMYSATRGNIQSILKACGIDMPKGCVRLLPSELCKVFGIKMTNYKGLVGNLVNIVDKVIVQ